MSDRNIDQSIRKPRRTKGTPLFKQRHYYTLGCLGLSALSGWLYLSWGQSKKLGKDALDGKFEYSDQLKEHIAAFQLSYDPGMRQVMLRLQEKSEEKAATPQPQSFFSKLFSPPDI